MADDSDYDNSDENVRSDDDERAGLEEIVGENISSDDDFDDGFGFESDGSDDDDDSDEEDDEAPKPRSDKPIPLPPGVSNSINRRAVGPVIKAAPPPAIVSRSQPVASTGPRRVVITRKGAPAESSSQGVCSKPSTSAAGSSTTTNRPVPKPATASKPASNRPVAINRPGAGQAVHAAKIQENRISSASKTIDDILDRSAN